MKNTRASYRYYNDKGIFEIWKILNRMWRFNIKSGFLLIDGCETFDTKRDCKARIEKEYGKLKNIQEINFNG